MDLAIRASKEAKCIRRGVGAVLVDDLYHVKAIGYNGPPSGVKNCTEEPCMGARMMSGTGLDTCLAIHAEQNAIIQCSDVHACRICVSSVSPCMHCMKMLANVPNMDVIIFNEIYDQEALDWWMHIGRYHMQVTPTRYVMA